jgi:diguanylate cyclase (GGDEF)-like protein
LKRTFSNAHHRNQRIRLVIIGTDSILHACFRGWFSLSDWKKEIPKAAVLASVYFIAGKLGLALAFVHPSSTAIWPATGIALAAFLIFGYRIWPGVLLGAFFVNLTTAGTVLTSICIAAGNTLEGLAGAYLVAKFANGRRAFDRTADTFKFALLAGVVAPLIAATFGVTALASAGFAPWTQFKPIWLTWWLGDGVGAILVAPLILLWAADFGLHWGWKRLAEMTALVAGLILVAETVFCGLFVSGVKSYPLEYLCIPFLLWSALRFGQKEAAAVTVMLSAIATWGTLHGFGPFVAPDKNSSLLLLQAFMAIVAVMTMALAAMSAERRHMESDVVSLAVTDPLTGLANYRKLVDVLDAEVKRSNRTGRPFSLLLIDMDHLKEINDQFGHLAGSHALCRLSDILRVYCRGIDTAARYGGDEFALVMPETNAQEAQQVALRICARVQNDVEEPPISVSIGTAVYPNSGETIELLLSAADRAMYQMKGDHHLHQHHHEMKSSQYPAASSLLEDAQNAAD